MRDQLELGALEERRPALLQNQFDLALEFYAIESHDDDSRIEHRSISQQMARNAIDLVLPHVLKNMNDRGLTGIALVAPLRGALGLVTPETESHLNNRLAQLGVDCPVELWAQGIKRHPEEDSAEVYYAKGYMDGNKEDTHVIILDWGTATGLTNDHGAHHIHDHGGVPFAQMTSLSMALADKGRRRLQENCVDPDGGVIHTEAATLALLNKIDYIYALAPGYGGGGYVEVTPKDWGAEMWGMEIEGDTDIDRDTQIEDFLAQFSHTFRHIIDERDIRFLREYYQSKYLTKNYTQ